MAEVQFRRSIATFIRRAPWVARTALTLWRIPQARFTAGVVGVVFNTSDQVLLVEHVFRPRHPWGLPGGWVDRREDPAMTIRREMLEELAFEITVGPVLLAQVDEGSHLDLAYLCIMNSPIGKLSKELLDYQWVTLSELPRLHHFHYHAIQQALAIRKIQ